MSTLGIPTLDLCKRIPKGKFEDSVLVWRYSPALEGVFDEPFVVALRSTSEYRNQLMFPAPILEEILNDLPEGVQVHMKFAKNGKRYFQVSHYSDSNWVTNPSTSALRLWLKSNSI